MAMQRLAFAPLPAGGLISGSAPYGYSYSVVRGELGGCTAKVMLQSSSANHTRFIFKACDSDPRRCLNEIVAFHLASFLGIARVPPTRLIEIDAQVRSDITSRITRTPGEHQARHSVHIHTHITSHRRAASCLR